MASSPMRTPAKPRWVHADSVTEQCPTSFAHHLHSTRYNNTAHTHPSLCCPRCPQASCVTHQPQKFQPLSDSSNTRRTNYHLDSLKLKPGIQKAPHFPCKAARWTLNKAQQLLISPEGERLSLHQKFRQSQHSQSSLQKHFYAANSCLAPSGGKGWTNTLVVGVSWNAPDCQECSQISWKGSPARKPRALCFGILSSTWSSTTGEGCNLRCSSNSFPNTFWCYFGSFSVSGQYCKCRLITTGGYWIKKL